jgi:hypothetical protein
LAVLLYAVINLRDHPHTRSVAEKFVGGAADIGGVGEIVEQFACDAGDAGGVFVSYGGGWGGSGGKFFAICDGIEGGGGFV